MDLVDHLLRVFALLGRDRRERVEEILVLARSQCTPLDAEFFHGTDEAEAVHYHADGPDEARLVDEDAVSRRGNVVGAGRADFLDDGVDRRVWVLGAQTTNLIVDLAGLHRAAARAVDLE